MGKTKVSSGAGNSNRQDRERVKVKESRYRYEIKVMKVTGEVGTFPKVRKNQWMYQAFLLKTKSLINKSQIAIATRNTFHQAPKAEYPYIHTTHIILHTYIIYIYYYHVCLSLISLNT